MPDDPIDLFASLRPDDETLAAADRDAIWTRLSGRPAPTAAMDEIDLVDVRAEAGRRHRVLAIAAAAAIVLAVLVVATRRDGASDRGGSTPAATTPTTFRPTTTGATEPPTTSLVTTPPTDPTSNGATSLPPFTVDSTVPLAPDSILWFLPTWLPNGVEVWVAHSAPVLDPGFAITTQSRWLKRGADGRTVVASIWLIVGTPAPGFESQPDSNATVHGMPANLLRGGRNDSVVSLTWFESGHSWRLGAYGTRDTELLDLAEKSTARATGTLSLAADAPFEAADQLIAPMPAGTGMSLTAGHYVSGRLGQWLNISTTPAFDGETLDDVATIESRRVTIDGIERAFIDSPPDDAQSAQLVRWYAAGYRITVTVKDELDRANLEKLIAGIRPAGPDQMRAAYDALSARGLAAPAIDTGAAPDGTTLSIRGKRDGVRYACASIDGASRCVVGSRTEYLDETAGEWIAPTVVLVGDQAVVIGWGTPQSVPPTQAPYPTAPGQEVLVSVPGETGSFLFARRTAGHGDPRFPAPSGEVWDEFWATPAG